MSFQNKYLKYKNKYLDLKNKIGGSSKKVPPKPDFYCGDQLIIDAEEGGGRLNFLLAQTGPGKCDINDKDRHGTTALMNATSKNDLEVVKYLLNHGADINIKNKNGWSALSIAKGRGFLNIEILLEDRLRAIAKLAEDARLVEVARLAEVDRLAKIAKLESDRLAELENLKAEIVNLKAEVSRLTEEAKAK